GKDLLIDCDYSLQALASLTNNKHKTSFDIYLQNVTHVASSSSSRAVSCMSNGSSTSSINNSSVGMYLEDRSKPAKPLLSDGWTKVLGEIGHVRAYNPEHTCGAGGRNLNQKYSTSAASSLI
ncbi:hypothetical protein C5167_020480, partial [Papaver somniferum]